MDPKFGATIRVKRARFVRACATHVRVCAFIGVLANFSASGTQREACEAGEVFAQSCLDLAPSQFSSVRFCNPCSSRHLPLPCRIIDLRAPEPSPTQFLNDRLGKFHVSQNNPRGNVWMLSGKGSRVGEPARIQSGGTREDPGSGNQGGSRVGEPGRIQGRGTREDPE